MHIADRVKKEFLTGIASALLLSACGQPEPISYESIVWVNNYYVEHPVSSLNASAGGWLFRGAKEVGTEIRVGFLVPGPMNPDVAKRKAVLNSVCPARSEVIWQVLSDDNKLVIDVWSDDRKFKDSTVC
ncbi:MAG TPA: hypothetical protein VIS57_03110 [Xanthomonadales bacterium]